MANEKVVYTSVRDEKEKNEKEDDLVDCEAPKGIGVRHIQAILLFISLSVAISMRAQLSVSMVAMTSKSVRNAHNTSCHTISSNETIDFLSNSTSMNGSICHDRETKNSWSVYQTYKWTKPTQEMIMFSFFVGYTTMNLPMGVIGQKFGGKLPIMIAMGTNGVLSIMTPWLPIFGGWLAICVCRLLQGATQAALYPSIHAMLGKWTPLTERGRLSTYIYAGSPFGTIVGFQVAGLLAGSTTFGWPWSFWMCGVASLICSVLVWWLCAATPHDHPKISPQELSYITGNGNADVIPKKRRTPWKHILTSKLVWCLVMSHAGSAIGYLFMLTQTPTYMSKILGVNIKNSGLYSSLPYISMYFMTLLFGYLADLFANKKIMSVTNIRRTANTIGMVVSGGFLLVFCYSNNTTTAVIMLIVGLGLHSGVHVGFVVNYIDLAPNFAGPLMGIGNTIGSLSSLIIPVLVSNIVKNDMTNQFKWQIVFIIVLGIQALTNFVYVLFAKCTVQPWNFYGEVEEAKKEDAVVVTEQSKEKIGLMEEV